MKKTTYIMLGAFLAGLIGVMVVVASFKRSCIVEVEEYTLGGDTVSIPLEPVHKVTFVDNRTSRNSIQNYRGISVLESDTARGASLLVTEGWLPGIKYSNDSGALTIEIDLDALLKKYNVEMCVPGEKCNLKILKSENIVIATIVVPRGILKEVAARRKTIYLDSIHADEILSKVDDRLVINNSHINTLNSRAKIMSELKLDNSTIDKAIMKAVGNNFKVTCTSNTSMIKDMYIEGGYSKSVSLNLEKAHIENFKWNPDDTVTKVKITVGNYINKVGINN